MNVWKTLAFWLFLLSSLYIVIAIFFDKSNLFLILGLLCTCLNWLLFLYENRRRRQNRR